MASHGSITIGEIRTIDEDGRVDLITRDALIRPDRYMFDGTDELHAYLREVLGGRPVGEGLRGSMSRKGTYSRTAADGSAAVTFGDPILDAISSSSGHVIIQGETLDLGADADALRAGADVTAAAASELKFTGVVNGAERWASDDRSTVQYRIGTGRLTFHAWKKRNITSYWSMGAEISVSGTNATFDFADIESRYFMSVTEPCQLVANDIDADRDDTYLDEFEWGINSQQPERVVSRCRAQWHHAQFADVVTAGSGCLGQLDLPWDAGFPPAWTAINTLLNLNGAWTDGSSRKAVITAKVNAFTINMSAFNRPAASGTIVDYSSITATFPDDQTYTGRLEGPDRIRWSNGSVWTKVVRTLFDLNGKWTDGSSRRAVIFCSDTSLKINMSDFDRTAATGSVVDVSTIKVAFPDETTHTGSIQPPGRVIWDNGSAWTKI